MFEGLLPIGSVVLLKESTKKLMIVGVCQLGSQSKKKIWDYTGVIYPEGFLSPDKMFLFNNEQIAQVYAIGYQDLEQLEFKKKVDTTIIELRSKED